MRFRLLSILCLGLIVSAAPSFAQTSPGGSVEEDEGCTREIGCITNGTSSSIALDLPWPNGSTLPPNAITSQRANHGAPAASPVLAHGNIVFIDNNRPNDIFVPLKTQTEFNAFKDNVPANVNLVPGCLPMVNQPVVCGQAMNLPLGREGDTVTLTVPASTVYVAPPPYERTEVYECIPDAEAAANNIIRGQWTRVSTTNFCEQPSCPPQTVSLCSGSYGIPRGTVNGQTYSISAGYSASQTFRCDISGATGNWVTTSSGGMCNPPQCGPTSVGICSSSYGLPAGNTGAVATASGGYNRQESYTCVASGNTASWQYNGTVSGDCVNPNPPDPSTFPPQFRQGPSCSGGIGTQQLVCPSSSGAPGTCDVFQIVNTGISGPNYDYVAQIAYYDYECTLSFVQIGCYGFECTICFSADTPINMADRTTRPVAAIKIGDRVQSFAADGSLTEAKVVGVTHNRSKLLRINGASITPNHPMLTPTGNYVPASLLKKGDKLVGGDGTLIEVTSIEVESEEQDVYNLVTENGEPLIAMGLRVGAYNTPFNQSVAAHK